MGPSISNYSQKIKRKIQCTLCPHMCMLQEGKTGRCGVRRNLGGKVRSKNYGIASGIAVDPIEKKPLYHFYPGSKILSVGSWGCNLSCNFCQNWQISQTCNGDNIDGTKLNPEEILTKAIEDKGNIGVAYTYNEPTVWIEYMLDTARLIKKNNLLNVMVSNGYINHGPLLEILEYMDAFNIDIKAFENSFYREMAGGELQPVLETIKTIANSGKHIELTNLVIQGKNDNHDSFKDMMKWIVSETGPDTVLHLSAYIPRYKQTTPATTFDVLKQLKEIAKHYLNYVYIGNVNTPNHTNCKKCGSLLVSRNNYSVVIEPTLENGQCTTCGQQLYKEVDF